MRSAKQISLFVLFLLALSVGVQAEEQLHATHSVVLVIGTGRIYADNVAVARNRAISNSLVSAIENVVKDFLPLESLVQNFQVINNILYSNTEEFVQGYKVLTEALSGNTYRVMVQATVSIEKVQQQLSIAGIMIGKKSMPRVLFFIAEQSTEDSLPQYWWGEGMSAVKSVAENSMAGVMMKKGFLIINYKNLAQNLRNETLDELDHQEAVEILSLEPELDHQEAVELGVRVNADVVIVGKAIASKAPNIMGKNIKSFKGAVTVRAFRADTGEEIAFALQTAVSTNVDEVAGGRAALSDAGALAGKDLSSQILEEWRKEIKKLVNIELVVKGTANFANFVQFRKILNDISGVNRVQLKEMRLDEAVLSVDFQGNAKELADALMLKAFDSFGINIYEVSQNRLRIELIPSE
ncbi:MAG: hypothetical protein ISS67_01020 [Desulfobacterales bacterium]|uniref:Flagellar assembly protein T N-terminal domain-containing protein n=1 Tax=Candidatus Desulfaltia bathyphila TaxID=2841697 RepID=A0A8J6N6K6_9BACT|nr:hypothetical protein [Candidatus Desulfaltia bathyphila]MBL7195404.1 hypothetical protein [Desulfobacterales bacterium]MBL7207092.1 hypothetical protein [Desulfobacterales bacterium]